MDLAVVAFLWRQDNIAAPAQATAESCALVLLCKQKQAPGQARLAACFLFISNCAKDSQVSIGGKSREDSGNICIPQPTCQHFTHHLTVVGCDSKIGMIV